MFAARKNRVLMLLQNSPYSQDGRVMREATALRDAGFQVTVLGPRKAGEPLALDMDGVCVYQYPQPATGPGRLGYILEYAYSMTALFLLSLLAFGRRGFDVVHAHNPPDFLVTIGVFYKLFGRRFVFDHHDLAPEMHQLRFPGARGSILQKMLVFFERLSCRWADHIIAANESHKRVEQERSGVPASRITVVRNGPEPKHFAAVEPHPSFCDLNKTVIGYVGEMGPLDGLDCLLRIFRSLRYDLQRDDWLGVLVGDGEVFDSLKRLAAELEIADHVRFVGRVSFAEVVPLIQAMDICTIPDPLNVYTQNCTLIKTMEYMAQSKPIVAFDLPETRFSAEDAAIYLPHGDERGFAQALSDLMDDPPRREAMGRAGRKRAEEELAWRRWIPNLLAVYQELTGVPADSNFNKTNKRTQTTARREELLPVSQEAAPLGEFAVKPE